jgi:hypothetical protein
MTQSSLFPIVCDRNKPPPATADADCIAINSGTQKRYLCKSTRCHTLLPAIEWICASLARSCEIAVPDWEIVQLKGSDEKMFGSVWEGGSQDWTTALSFVTNPELFSDAYALDMTTHNEDRHINNYLYMELAGDIVVKVIDASRAFVYHGWPLPALPLKPNSNTITNRRLWERFHPHQPVRAHNITLKIAGLPPDWMATTLAKMPAEWMGSALQSALSDWWVGSRNERLIEVQHQLL